MEFKDRIKGLRKERKMTTTTLAAEFGKSDTSIRMWETGKSKPDVDTLMRIASYFDCSVDYLLGLSDYKNKDSWRELENAESDMQERLTSFSGRKSFINSLIYLFDSLGQIDDIQKRNTTFSLIGQVLCDCGTQAVKSNELCNSEEIRHDAHYALLLLNEDCEANLREYRNELRRAACRKNTKLTSFGKWFTEQNSIE